MCFLAPDPLREARERELLRMNPLGSMIMNEQDKARLAALTGGAAIAGLPPHAAAAAAAAAAASGAPPGFFPPHSMHSMLGAAAGFPPRHFPPHLAPSAAAAAAAAAAAKNPTSQGTDLMKGRKTLQGAHGGLTLDFVILPLESFTSLLICHAISAQFSPA